MSPISISGQSRRDRFTVEAGSGTLIDPTSPAGVQPVGQTGRTLVFSDEFNGAGLDSWKWLPWYPDTAFWNTTVPGGHLTNTAEPQAYDPSGISFPGGSVMRFTMRNQVTVTGLPYTSGMVSSYPSFNPTYGYFEARMKLPDVSGTWPAFWMHPTDMVWPPEIDIMENWGRESFNNIISQGSISSNGNTAEQKAVTGGVSQWNTYACDWRSGTIRFYINGTLSKTDTNALIPAKQMYLICNLAGDKDNFPAASTMPFFADVDYIRAWA